MRVGAGTSPRVYLGVLRFFMPLLNLKVELEREAESGRWIADVVTIPGVMVYGKTKADALRKAQALVFEVLADRFARREDPITGHARKFPRVLAGVKFASGW